MQKRERQTEEERDQLPGTVGQLTVENEFLKKVPPAVRGIWKTCSASETDVARPAVRLVAEAGFLRVIDHRIRFAEEDSTFRYQNDGGQDVLFPFARLSAELPPGFTVDGVEFEGGAASSRSTASPSTG